MALTEQPVDIVSTRGAYGAPGTFVLGDHAKRVNWINSFYVPPDAHVASISNFFGPVPPFIGYGAVKDSNGRLTDQIGFADNGSVTGFEQIYISEPQTGVITGQFVQAASLTPTFPAGSLPLAVIVLDAVRSIQQVYDWRPSSLSSVPDLGSGMKESIADPTRRVYFQNNFAVPRTYSLSSLIPADVALPCSGFTLGAGAVTLSGNPIANPATYFSSTTKPATSNPVYKFYGSLTPGIVQVYVDPGQREGFRFQGFFRPTACRFAK